MIFDCSAHPYVTKPVKRLRTFTSVHNLTHGFLSQIQQKHSSQEENKISQNRCCIKRIAEISPLASVKGIRMNS